VRRTRRCKVKMFENATSLVLALAAQVVAVGLVVAL
jgi:flagellar biosynthesis protein FliQ